MRRHRRSCDALHVPALQHASGVAIKLCRRCNQHKPLSDFYRSKANADGYDGRCKACDAVQCAERRRKKPRVEVLSQPLSVLRCGWQPTPVSPIPPLCSLTCPCATWCCTSHMHHTSCIVACSGKGGWKGSLISDVRADRTTCRLQEPTVPGKECRRCSQYKPATDFYRNKTNPDGLYNNCKSCFANDAVNRRQRMAPLEQRTVSAKACTWCS